MGCWKFFLARIRQNHQRQKRCGKRGKLLGVEDEKIEKSDKLKVWRRFKIQNFSTYKKGRLTSNLGLNTVGSLTFCI